MKELANETSGAVSRGEASWTCDLVLALGQRFASHSVYSDAIPLGKGLTAHYLVFSDGT